MSWLRADSLRFVAVAGLVSAMTAFVWTKVQLSEAALSAEAARTRLTELREERSKLQAAVDLAQRPGVVGRRARGELSMTHPGPERARDLAVRVSHD